MGLWKSLLSSVAVIVLVTACATAPQHSGAYDGTFHIHMDDTLESSRDSLLLKKSEEEAAWRKLDRLSAEVCGATPSPPAREKAVEISYCISELVNKYLLPYSAFPDLVLPSRAEALRIAQDYAGGKISATEYRRRSEERVRNYEHAWLNRARTRLALRSAQSEWQGDVVPTLLVR
jgi:hypothetical protein